MTSNKWTTVASALHARHYAAIAKALRTREYNARSVRGRWGRCIRVAVPDTDLWAWWGISTAWWDTTTARGTWAGILYLGRGQIVNVGEFLTEISSTETDVEKIAEGIAIMVDEAEMEACCDKWW